jgi:hypothetical protein
MQQLRRRRFLAWISDDQFHRYCRQDKLRPRRRHPLEDPRCGNKLVGNIGILHLGTTTVLVVVYDVNIRCQCLERPHPDGSTMPHLVLGTASCNPAYPSRLLELPFRRGQTSSCRRTCTNASMEALFKTGHLQRQGPFSKALHEHCHRACPTYLFALRRTSILINNVGLNFSRVHPQARDQSCTTGLVAIICGSKEAPTTHARHTMSLL